MEFRAQDHHHHNNNHTHNPHHHHDQIRSATATSAPSFTPHPALAPVNLSPSDRRRSLSSNNNNNTSTMTSSTQPPIPIPSQTPSNCTTTQHQTLAPPPPQKPSSAAAAAKYRECQKNHAASAGGSVYDGCGEFMPSGEEGSLEALKCAACSCHRNFHRKELDGGEGTLAIYSPGTRRSSSTANPLQITPPPPLHHLNHYPSPYSHHHSHHGHHKFPIVQPMNVAYGGGGGAESSSEELNATADNSAPAPYSSSSAKKRFRTKFTAEQKERMLEFAERVGWRFQKQDEELVERFCSEVGIRRQVLKVWMHNNKSTNLKATANNNKHQLDHVSILMGNMVGPTSAVPVSASIPVAPPPPATTTTTDVVMNQQHVSDDDEEGLD